MTCTIPLYSQAERDEACLKNAVIYSDSYIGWAEELALIEHIDRQNGATIERKELRCLQAVTVLRMRKSGLTYRKIGEQMKLAHERIRQIHAKALRIIARYKAEKGLDF